MGRLSKKEFEAELDEDELPLDEFSPKSKSAKAPDDKSDPTFTIGQSFAEQLRTKYRLVQGELGFIPSASASEFVRLVNKEMHDSLPRGGKLREDPLHPLTGEQFRQMMEGKIGPTPEIVTAMTAPLKLFGDHREDFIAKGVKASQEELERRKQEAERLKAEALERRKAATAAREAKEEEARQVEAGQLAKESAAYCKEHRQQWRENNPRGKKIKPSFQEMLEDCHLKGEDFKVFLFDRVLPAWDMSQVGFCRHLEALNEGKDTKATLTDTVLSSWHMGKTKPLRESVDVICSAFNIVPAEGEKMARHEQMLWKGIDGHAFRWKTKTGPKALDAAIADAKRSGETGALVKELIDASGIRSSRVSETLNVQQLPMWMKGAKIENVDMAIDFLRLVNPQPLEEVPVHAASGDGVQDTKAETHRMMSRQNRELLGLVTGRQFDVKKAIDEAEQKGNPGGELFTLLTGRKGVATLTPEEVIVQFKAKGIDCTAERIKKMRTGTQLQRGGKIWEREAEAIVDMAEGATRHLVEIGVMKPWTDELKERCVDVLTGIRHPRKMLQECVSGDMAINDMVRETYERRNLNQYGGEDSFCAQIGVSHLSGFITGKSAVTRDVAEKMADWYERNYQLTGREKARFVALAQGIDLQRTPDTILDEVMSGKLDRVAGLREIYDFPGISRESLAERAKVDYHTISYSVTETSGGRLVNCTPADLRRIGKVAGISRGKLDDFAATYDGGQVARQSVLKKPEPGSAEPPEETLGTGTAKSDWVDTAANSQKGGMGVGGNGTASKPDRIQMLRDLVAKRKAAQSDPVPDNDDD